MKQSSLSQINREGLKFESRNDGMYLLVKTDLASDFEMENLRRVLDLHFVMNYDWDRIKDIITKATGKFEYAGEVFDVYEREKDELIYLQATSKEVSLSISDRILDTQHEITVKDVSYKMKLQGICYNIFWDSVAKIVNDQLFNNPVRIAECTPAEEGNPARIKDVVNIEINNKPLIMSNGQVDFKNIKSFPQVKQGEILAEKLPPTQGVDGTDVFGNVIHAKEGLDKAFDCGQNTLVSKDGRCMVAAVDGVVFRRDNRTHVEEILIVPKDVDFSTGHIKYKGNIVICGNVLSGFKIDTYGDIRIEGGVEGAEITSRKGNIEIMGGVFGKKKAKIFAHGFVYAKMIQDAQVKCQKEFRADKNVFSCNIWASEIILPNNCRISSNNFYAYEKIEIDGINKNNEGNTLTVIDKVGEEKSKKLDKLNDLLEKTTDSLKPLENRIRAMAAMMKKMEEAPTPKIREEIKSVQDQYRILQKKIAFINEQIKKTQSITNINIRDGIIVLKGRIQAAIKLNMYGTELDISEPLEDRAFIWTEEGIDQCSVPEPGDSE